MLLILYQKLIKYKTIFSVTPTKTDDSKMDTSTEQNTTMDTETAYSTTQISMETTLNDTQELVENEIPASVDPKPPASDEPLNHS